MSSWALAVGRCRDTHTAMDSESDIESDTSSVAYMDITSRSSATSYEADQSMRSSSPVSVISINSTAQFFKNEHGRRLNNYSDIYQLPADAEELARLDKQHNILTEIIGYKYVPGMSEVMTDDGFGEPKACLDLGCGAGSWIIDVANDFPRCNAVAVDLIPMQESIMPPNLRSEVDDINMGLEHYYDSFDVVHTRFIAAGIRDYHRLVDQIARVVRPGGLIDLTEFDFQTYDHNGQCLPVDRSRHSPPWWARWLSHMHDAIDEKGGDVHAATHLHSWVARNSAFESVVYKEHFLSVMPPQRKALDGEIFCSVDEGMRDIVLSFVRAGRPLLLGIGIPEGYLLDLEENVAQEIYEGKGLQYARLQCVYARRKLDVES